MNRITKTFITTLTFLAPIAAHAQIANKGGGGPFEDLLVNIIIFTNDVLIPFIIGIGFLVFVWGMFLYFIAGGANEESREKGKSLMVYGVVGFVLIIIFFGIVNLLTQSTGLEGQTLKSTPTITVPSSP